MIVLNRILHDFSDEHAHRVWHPISDTVMGGRSVAELIASTEGTAVFSGVVSLENNGGFASIRSESRDYDLRGSTALVLDARGDGRRYKVNLKTDDRFDGVLYRHEFDTRPDVWQTVTLPFAEFRPTLRGRHLPNVAPLDLGRVRSIGLMVSDGPGPFRLELRAIKAIGA